MKITTFLSTKDFKFMILFNKSKLELVKTITITNDFI